MKERLILIRKHFRLSQAGFGLKLGVGRGVIANIELGRTDATDLFLCHVCDIFHISKEWLLNGIGEMLRDDEEDVFEPLVEKYNLSSIDRAIMSFYATTSEEERKAISNFIVSIANVVTNARLEEMMREEDQLARSLEDDDDEDQKENPGPDRRPGGKPARFIG